MKHRRKQVGTVSSGRFMYVCDGIDRPRQKPEAATEYSRSNAVDIAMSFCYPQATIDAIECAKTRDEITAILERARISAIIRDFKE